LCACVGYPVADAVPDAAPALVIGQESRESRCPLGTTAWAEASFLAACRHEELITAVRTSDTSKARLEPATVKIGVDNIIDEDPPESVVLLEALLPDVLNLVVECLDQAIQGRLLRLASTIEADSSTLGGQGKAPSLSQRGGIN